MSCIYPGSSISRNLSFHSIPLSQRFESRVSLCLLLRRQNQSLQIFFFIIFPISRTNSRDLINQCRVRSFAQFKKIILQSFPLENSISFDQKLLATKYRLLKFLRTRQIIINNRLSLSQRSIFSSKEGTRPHKLTTRERRKKKKKGKEDNFRREAHSASFYWRVYKFKIKMISKMEIRISGNCVANVIQNV